MRKIYKEKIIDEFICTYLDNPANKTISAYRNLIKDFLDSISCSDVVFLRKINEISVKRYLNSNKEWEQNTRRHKTILIKNFLKFLYRRNYLKEFIYYEIKLPSKVNIDKYFPNDEDIKKFFKAINRVYKNKTDKILFRTIYGVYYKLGLRFSELIKLNYEDIDFEWKKIFLKDTKTNEGPLIEMDSELERILKDYIKYFNIKSGPLFRSKRGGRIYRCMMDSNFNKIKKAAGLHKEFTNRCFRRNFITTLDKNGVRPSLMQKLARHKDINTTMIYIGHNENERREAMAKVKLDFL